ncbi:AraC family transcriptional regulator [Bdellovibrio sp. SKB1291214]|uniref:AraC family transcriptional regulator n=1 Tax=Bdellovibrio sp. SKB1291214 TaxID=1732569 RepID=UPI00223FFF9C|nr:AraC family transcriptional regulator [Bdellovibrio sp. SKB1291214]UYL08852.1 AraC family transcriptional regulator [Bdellovibrio sp. SKB1291214]
MKDLASQLLKAFNDYGPPEGTHPTPVTGVYCTKISQDRPKSKLRWRACLGIVVQGCKEIVLGRSVYRAELSHFTATPFELPVTSRVPVQSKDKPFLAILIEINPQLLTEVAAQMSHDFLNEKDDTPRALFAGEADEQMLEAALRLTKLFIKPEDATVVGPLIVREILYYLLKTSQGSAIRQVVSSGSKMHQVSKALFQLKSDLHQPIDVNELAKVASMSRSAFFKHFKEVTAMSPIQYQKRLRLLEAKRLMMDENETAESSAFKVGYKSASQFSREYSRMFGKAPLKDVTALKKR